MNYTFNKYIENLKPSASIALMEKASLMRASGENIISLAGGEPDFDTPASVAYAGIQGICKGHTHYTSGRGIVPLRKRIAKKLYEDNQIICDPDDVLVTPGGKYSIYLSLRTILNAGDEVLIFDPSWVSYAPIVEASAGVPIHVELKYKDNYKITEESLARLLTPKTKAMIINTPNNPTGRMLTSEEAEIITKIALKHELIVISDEIYEKIAFEGNKHISVGSIPDIAGQVITVNGFSKCAAMTGWRLGYLSANRILVDKIYKLYQHTLTCVSEFCQEAAVVALDSKEEIKTMCEVYENRRIFFIEALQKIPGVSCRFPEGAFYAWAQINKDEKNSEEISNYLLEKAKVVTVPGSAYGLGGDKCIRMSFATATSDLYEAAERIKKALS